MVQILPEVPSFGKQFAQSLGGGLGAGISNAADFATQLAKAKAKLDFERKIMSEQAEATVPKSEREDVVPDGKSGSIPSQDLAGGEESNALLNAKQQRQLAAQMVKERARTANPVTYEQALSLVRQQNAARAEERSIKEAFGTQAENILSSVYPDASPRMLQTFAKKFENAGFESLSPEQIKKRITSEAYKVKNQVNAIRKSLPPPRAFTKIKEAALGTSQSRKNAESKIKKLIDPLLKEGLFEETEQLLMEKGYAPEETANLITSLGQGSRQALADFPEIKKGRFRKAAEEAGFLEERLNENEQQIFKENLKQALKNDPAANLLLLRRSYEDKGVDWKSFEEALSELQGEGVELNENQQRDFNNYIDQPPLDRLGKFLHGLNLIGR